MSVARDRVVDEYDSATVFGGKFGANFLSLVHRNDELICNTNLPTESPETRKTLLAQAQESRRSLGDSTHGVRRYRILILSYSS